MLEETLQATFWNTVWVVKNEARDRQNKQLNHISTCLEEKLFCWIFLCMWILSTVEKATSRLNMRERDEGSRDTSQRNPPSDKLRLKGTLYKNCRKGKVRLLCESFGAHVRLYLCGGTLSAVDCSSLAPSWRDVNHGVLLLAGQLPWKSPASDFWAR